MPCRDRAPGPGPPLIAFSYSKSAPRLDAAFESSVDILPPIEEFGVVPAVGFRITFSANMSLIMPCVVSAFGGVVADIMDVELICRELFKLLTDKFPGPS